MCIFWECAFPHLTSAFWSPVWNKLNWNVKQCSQSKNGAVLVLYDSWRVITALWWIQDQYLHADWEVKAKGTAVRHICTPGCHRPLTLATTLIPIVHPCFAFSCKGCFVKSLVVNRHFKKSFCFNCSIWVEYSFVDFARRLTCLADYLYPPAVPVMSNRIS